MTYSIVARDPATGELGVAVQSHYFSTGSVVTWAEAGVGAVATQSLVKVDYGPEGIALMRDGRTAAVALAELVARDKGGAVRQVAMVDASGGVAAHTGERCIADAGHVTGDGYSVQANMMANATVWGAMDAAYQSATGDLAERLLAALDAAQAAGGDIRGQQSAAMLVVGGEKSEWPWRHVVLELRVEDHPRPLDELRRLLTLQRAYRINGEGDAAAARGEIDEAMTLYEHAAAMAPGNTELSFWAGIAMMRAGREDRARELLLETFAAEPGFADLVPRLLPLGAVTGELVARIAALRSDR